jgi:8-oxo-dGTP pyrophosphatase MutT (NUDIX family)
LSAAPRRSQEAEKPVSMDRASLIAFLQRYRSPYEEERHFVPRFLSLLRNFDNCYARALSTGHLTASAFIVDARNSATLLVLHRKLGRWLQPGGHADGDENLVQVALREAGEETGLKRLSLRSGQAFDIDIHPIPARGELKTHFHYDLRFLVEGSREETLEPNAESVSLAWFGWDELEAATGANRSIRRMMEKVLRQNKS